MNNIYLIIIIIVIIILLYLFRNRKERFKVTPDDIVGSVNKKYIGEVYEYPDCIGCMTNDNKMKPGFKYIISDNRCVYNTSGRYIDNTILQNIDDYDYTSLNLSDVNSCYPTYNSLYSSVKGKHIMLIRQDSTPMKFSHISVYSINNEDISNKSVSLASLGAVIYSTELVKQGTNYIYPESVLNSIDDTVTFQSGGLNSYVLITLNNVYDISYVNIKHSNINDAASLNNATLVVLDDLENTDGIFGVIKFYNVINTIELDRTIYTYNHLSSPLPNYLFDIMMVINDWTIPCDNCASANGKLFAGHYYNEYDGTLNSTLRCYRPIDGNIDRIIINNTISDSDLSTKFKSCSPDFDTRYMPTVGKFIQIKRSDNRDIGINISNISIFSDYKYNVISIDTLSALVNRYYDSNSLFENATTDNDSTLKTTNDRNSFIHIDMGTTNNIYLTGIMLKIPIAERYNIVGITFLVISVDVDIFDTTKMKLTSERTITSDDVQNANSIYGDNEHYLYLIPFPNNRNVLISERPDIVINNTVTYNSIDKYLSTYKKGSIYYQIPHVIYNMSNGRRVIAKSLTDVSDTLEKINVSDAVTLFNFSNNQAMDSVPSDNVDMSYLLTPIVARYIQIKPNGTDDLNGVIKSITLYASDKSIIKSINNPSLVYETNVADYTKYLSDVVNQSNDNYILIDIGNDTGITFIKINIDVSFIDKINNVVLNMIGNNGNKKYTYTITNPHNIITSDNDIYLVTDNNEINLAGSFFINKYAYPNCLTMDICNTIAPDTYYIADGGVCFKSKSANELITCITGNCMNNLQDYSKTNKVQFVEDNMISCDPLRETRFIISLVIHFDASDLTTLFKNIDCTNVVTRVGDSIGCWKTTSDSALAVNAISQNGSNSRLSVFTPGTSAVDLRPDLGNGTWFKYNCDISSVNNVTNILVLIRTSKERTGHPLNFGTAWFDERDGVVMENFYTNAALWSRTVYNYRFPYKVPIIYVVTANYETLKTKNYRYITSLAQITPDLPYGTEFKTRNPKIFGLEGSTYNNFMIAEMKLFNRILSDGEITNECKSLITKWNIPDPNPLLIHFDASDLTTLYVDSPCNSKLINVTDGVNCWSTTSRSLYSVKAVNKGQGTVAKLEEFTTGKLALSFCHSDYNKYCADSYTWINEIAITDNITYILVFKTLYNVEYVFHPVSAGAGGYIKYGNNVMEAFYTNSSDNGVSSTYTYDMPMNTPIIYVVTANNVTQITKCYRYMLSLRQISPDLTYGNVFKSRAYPSFGRSVSEYGLNNFFSVAELQIYDNVLSEESISTECEKLMTKWNILYPRVMVIHFDASDTSTLFQTIDKTNFINATQINDKVLAWNTTGQSYWNLTAEAQNSNPALTEFSSGKLAVDFTVNGGSGLYKFTKPFNYVEASMIIVMKALSFTRLGHPFSQYYGMMKDGSNKFKEYFYTTAYTNISQATIGPNFDISNPYIIYGINAWNVPTGVRMYYYGYGMYTQLNRTDVYYGTDINNYPDHYLGTGVDPTFNNFKLAELQIYNYAMTSTEIVNEMERLRVKWNIP